MPILFKVFFASMVGSIFGNFISGGGMRILSRGILAALMMIASTSISGAQSIEYVSSIDSIGESISIAVYGNYAYVANSKNDFKLIDVSDPSTPIIVREIVEHPYANNGLEFAKIVFSQKLI